jgi:teichuronic acid biosynthesis glycosyltransferase TuaC
VLRILTYSSLYPNAAQPAHGVFVEERLRHLVATGRVAAHVVAPVPWFPGRAARWGRYATFAAVPAHERRGAIDVHHPRHLVLPKIGMRAAPWLVRRGTERLARSLVASHALQLIDAHYLYPDGVAAASIAARLGLPYVLTARGSDVNLIGQFPACRRRMRDAVLGAAATIAVSEALKDRIVAWGVPAERVVVVRNGVDAARFASQPRAAARRALGVDGLVLLAVGKLDDNKGQELAVAALAALPEATLVIAGDGPRRDGLARIAAEAGVAGRVRFAGTVSHTELARYYSAADVLVLASAREGLPNVVLESLACGTPVVATRVGGLPEVIDGSELGELIDERTPAALAAAVRAVQARALDRSRIALAARRFDWRLTSERLLDVLERAAAGAPAAAPHPVEAM